MRAALVTTDGLVESLIVLPDGDPDPVPLFVDGIQQFDTIQVGLDDDGEPVYEQRPVMVPGEPFTPPPGLQLIVLDDTSPAGPGWTYTDDQWHAPEPDPIPEPPALDRLAALLEAAGITPEQVIEALG